MILGFATNISDAQIKGKTAYLFSRPLANIVDDQIDNQKLQEPSEISLLKNWS